MNKIIILPIGNIFPIDNIFPISRSGTSARPAVDTLHSRYPRVSSGSSSRCPARGSSGAATCRAAPAPTAQPRAAPGTPRVLRLQLPLPSPGQLRGHHVSCGSNSRWPAQGSFRAATCPLKAQRSSWVARASRRRETVATARVETLASLLPRLSTKSRRGSGSGCR
jgi:hypothetical protein